MQFLVEGPIKRGGAIIREGATFFNKSPDDRGFNKSAWVLVWKND